ncbi:MAG: c-type cytochrome domain-containing protein [Bryobacteraceae bacterium]
MRARLLPILLLLAANLTAATGYYRDVRPILQKNCQGCHQPASKISGLDLTTFEGFAKGGQKGAAFVAEHPDDSLVIKYLTAAVQPRMPMGQPPLPENDIATIRDWIRTGAKDDSPAEMTTIQTPVYLQPPVITALRFSPDGKEVAVSGNGEVLIHGIDGRAPLRRLIGGAERILSIVYSADGKLLIAGGGTPAQFGEVQIWDAKAGKLLHSIRLTNDTVFGASIAPDGSKIAVGCTDNSVHVFETATGKELYKISNHENWVLATVFGVDSKRLVSASRDRAAKLIDAGSGAFLENVNLLRDELTAIARHPTKDMVVIGGAERHPYIYLLDRPRNMKIADDTTLVRKLERQEGPITALDWSPDGSRIAVGGAMPSVNLYDPETGDKKASCAGHDAGIYAVAFSPDSSKLATGGFDGKIRIYNAADCTLLHSFVPAPMSAGVVSR